MLCEEVVFVREKSLNVGVFLMEAKVKIDFVLEPVVEVVGGDRADGMFVVRDGAVREGESVEGVGCS